MAPSRYQPHQTTPRTELLVLRDRDGASGWESLLCAAGAGQEPYGRLWGIESSGGCIGYVAVGDLPLSRLLMGEDRSSGI